MNKRDFIRATIAGIAGVSLAPGILKGNVIKRNLTGKLKFPDLAYGYGSLEPFMSEAVLRHHHSDIHRSYTRRLNRKLDRFVFQPRFHRTIFRNISHYPDIRNYAGAHRNHKIFWKVLSPKGGGEPTGKIHAMINDQFGSFRKFKQSFTEKALTQNSPGWEWLILKEGSLKIVYTLNEDNPLMDIIPLSEQGYPILACDCHEHAYKADYGNKRDYLNNFWTFVNWNFVNFKLNKGLHNHSS